MILLLLSLTTFWSSKTMKWTYTILAQTKNERDFLHTCIKKSLFHNNVRTPLSHNPWPSFMYQKDPPAMYQNDPVVPLHVPKRHPCSCVCTKTTPLQNPAPKQTLSAEMYQNDVFPLRQLGKVVKSFQYAWSIRFKGKLSSRNYTRLLPFMRNATWTREVNGTLEDRKVSFFLPPLCRICRLISVTAGSNLLFARPPLWVTTIPKEAKWVFSRRRWVSRHTRENEGRGKWIKSDVIDGCEMHFWSFSHRRVRAHPPQASRPGGPGGRPGFGPDAILRHGQERHRGAQVSSVQKLLSRATRERMPNCS